MRRRGGCLCSTSSLLTRPPGWLCGVLQLPLKPSFTVTHNPEVIKHVLTNTDTYGKGPVWRNT